MKVIACHLPKGLETGFWRRQRRISRKAAVEGGFCFAKSKTAVRQFLGRGEYRGFFNARARRVGGAVTVACATVCAMVTGRMGEASANAGFSHLVTTWKSFDGRPGNLSPPSSRVERGRGDTNLRIGYGATKVTDCYECGGGAGATRGFLVAPAVARGDPRLLGGDLEDRRGVVDRDREVLGRETIVVAGPLLAASR